MVGHLQAGYALRQPAVLQCQCQCRRIVAHRLIGRHVHVHARQRAGGAVRPTLRARLAAAQPLVEAVHVEDVAACRAGQLVGRAHRFGADDAAQVHGSGGAAGWTISGVR